MPPKARRSKTVLITGSAGLIGSEAVRFFAQQGFKVVGIDNDMRRVFFGAEASTRPQAERLRRFVARYTHHNIDIRDAKRLERLFRAHRFDLIIHAAAQPSHDWAAREPMTDFTVNAQATLGLLENFRKFCPEAVFIFLSTNKVYGDRPNDLPFVEMKTRYELPKTHPMYRGINETMSIDQCKHSLFGASKAAADLLVQEYGRYFNLRTVCFRGGCLTGPCHAGTELHGFLSYLGICVATGRLYKIFGYKGKQVRDNIHAVDLIGAMDAFAHHPKVAAVYNIGGGRFANISILEAIDRFERLLGRKARVTYVPQNRSGDHIWYVSDLTRFQKDYPRWELTHSIDDTIEDICKGLK
jgi:CDP-paratose 2-epimerase